ncbi:MAG: hypothetical protein PHT13_00315 [Methanosarcina sp.]|jgi:hypothetical protein|nr:hypothetical protein [Methanosarcina sp.]
MYCIEDDSFPNAWAKSIEYVMKYGEIRPSFGDSKKLIKHTPLAFDLGPNAVNQMLKRKLHPQYPQQIGLDAYCNQFIESCPECVQSKGSQPYTYYSRTEDQVRFIRDNHKLAIPFNKRIEISTWQPLPDLMSENPPCFQSANFVRINKDEVETTTFWRSHDLAGAEMWNHCGLMNYFNVELFEPEGLTPVRYVEFNASSHIYDYMWDAMKHVHVLPAGE